MFLCVILFCVGNNTAAIVLFVICFFDFANVFLTWITSHWKLKLKLFILFETFWNNIHNFTFKLSNERTVFFRSMYQQWSKKNYFYIWTAINMIIKIINKIYQIRNPMEKNCCSVSNIKKQKTLHKIFVHILYLFLSCPFVTLSLSLSLFLTTSSVAYKLENLLHWLP